LLDEAVRGFFKPAEKEGFEVSMMVFDDVKRRLVVVEGAIDGSEPAPKMWDFSLPFGLGLAGACFKEGERAFLYVRPDEQSPGPELYIPRNDDDIHDVLLALPIDHPQFAKYLTMKGLKGEKPERARQCIGVINIGSRTRTTNLRKTRTDTSVIAAVSDLCQDFANRAMISKL
jgi:hypothetical protein